MQLPRIPRAAKLTLASLLVASFLAFTPRAASTSAEPWPSPDAAAMSVVTLNLAKQTDASKILSELRSQAPLASADVLLLQEVKENAGHTVAGDIASRIGLQLAYAPAGPGITDQGLAILSRYPLTEVKVQPLKRYDLHFRSRSRIVLGATAHTPGGPIRVVNTHLDTRINPEERRSQMEQVLPAGTLARQVVGGDFNSNGFRWVGHMVPLLGFPSQVSDLETFMMARGYRPAVPAEEPTHDFLGMHLDWIWTRGLDAETYRTYPLRFSDHHAVLARIALPAH